MAWKTLPVVHRTQNQPDASMGPRFNGVEDLARHGVQPIKSDRFNGATL